MIKVQERISELRNKKGLSQAALGKIIRVSRSSVNAWEMGISIPSVKKLISLAEYFHVSIDYLLGIDNKLNIDITSLDEEQKLIIYNLIEIFINSKKSQN